MQLASSLFNAATSESSSPSGSAGRLAGGLEMLTGARGVASATGCRAADVSMVRLLALLESYGAGAGAETDACETAATGAGLLTGTNAGAFAGVITAGAGEEAATTGVARGAVTAVALTGAGCGAGAGAG